MKMTTNVSVGGGRITDSDWDAGVRRAKPLVPRVVLGTMDQRFRCFEQHFDDLIEHFDMIGTNVNKYRNIGRRRPRTGDAYDYPINQPVAAIMGITRATMMIFD